MAVTCIHAFAILLLPDGSDLVTYSLWVDELWLVSWYKAHVQIMYPETCCFIDKAPKSTMREGLG